MRRIDVDELYRLYHGAKQGSVRWEGLQIYRVPWEDEGLAAWRRGEPQPPSEESERSLASTRRAAEAGRLHLRVRGLRRPATEYTRHEFEVAYPENAAAGEPTVVVDLDEHPEFDGIEDFVVFDHDSVMWYRYDADCHLLGYDHSDDPALVADRAALLERMLAVAMPFTEVVL
ncbi:MAG: hypothetical protein H0W01_04680 [Pseudonocardiales bacterium]|nr:hypothetical protein [Pseudonocardiales bacterium]